ncbi:DNA mismatch repair protein Msh2-like protein, partial [Dinothrombium tinctorium]
RLTKKEEKSIRNKKNYILVEKGKKDGIRFINKDLQELNEEYLSIRSDYSSLQKDIAAEVIKAAASYSNYMRQLGEILAKLDVVVAMAVAARRAPLPYIRPTLKPKDTNKVVIKGLRHPCLETQNDISFIPNDINFDDKKFFIITGPNMGGKSTYIRSVGLCVLMAQIGSFVPANFATISVVDGIYTRIGASDQQIKGCSAFMVEMVETASILRCATENSLVIIDELGRGTSTFEGFGLAWSISEFIANKIKSYCLFATHFQELTSLSEQIPTIGNLHVSAITENEALTLLYKVEPGSCDRSFGIHVAKLASFPNHMIE